MLCAAAALGSRTDERCEGKWCFDGEGVVGYCPSITVNCSYPEDCNRRYFPATGIYTCLCGDADPAGILCKALWTLDGEGYVLVLHNCFTEACSNTCDENAAPAAEAPALYMCDCPP
jgi:hypothetical protein